jgi:hypothetical protein
MDRDYGVGRSGLTCLSGALTWQLRWAALCLSRAGETASLGRTQLREETEPGQGSEGEAIQGRPDEGTVEVDDVMVVELEFDILV